MIRNRATMILLAAVAVYASYASARYLAATINRPPAAPPSSASIVRGLSVELAELDLGAVWETENLRHPVTITNTTNTTIYISRFETACACSGVEPAQMDVGPNEKNDHRWV